MVQQSKKVRLKIKNNLYYFVDLKDPLNPRVINDSYINSAEAQRCMEKFLNEKRYFLIKGDELISYRGEFTIKKAPYALKCLKHDFGKIKVFSRPDKGHLRRMNLRRIRARKAKDLGIVFKKKHIYPEGCITPRQRASYREHQRRLYYRKIKAIY